MFQPIGGGLGGRWVEGDLVFDHPTPLDEQGTLGRCLESLNKLEGVFRLILLAVPTTVEIQDVLERKLLDLLEGLDLGYEVIPVFPSTLRELWSRSEIEDLKAVLNFNGYSHVRNACILVPYILGFEAFLLLDDDEVVSDRGLLDKAAEHLGEEFQGRRIAAKAGVYLQPHGSPFFKGRTIWWRLLLDSRRAMNEAFRIIEFGERILDTPFAFGGNMVISRAVVELVPFDPYIPRGEDIDFLVNVKSEGYAFVLDTALRILHLPPRSVTPEWMKFRQDAYRFLYMKRKLALLKELGSKRSVTWRDLMPYPGRFLDWTLEPRLLATSLLQSADHLRRLRFKEAGKALSVISLLLKDYRGQVLKYYGFKERWRRIVPELREDPSLKEALLKRSLKG